MPATRPGPKPSARGSDRRRSQRILLVIPVEISWASREGVRVREHAETEVVNAQGGLLRLKTRIPANVGEVEITRPQTHQKAKGRVISVSAPGPDRLVRVGVELAVPAQEFWGIRLPPEPADTSKAT